MIIRFKVTLFLENFQNNNKSIILQICWVKSDHKIFDQPTHFRFKPEIIDFNAFKNQKWIFLNLIQDKLSCIN